MPTCHTPESLPPTRPVRAAGVWHRTVVYEAAPHGFFRFGADWEPGSDDAWHRILQFTGVSGHSGTLQGDVVWWESASDRRSAALDDRGFAVAMRWLVKDFGRRTPSIPSAYVHAGSYARYLHPLAAALTHL
jgi:hypothetical protein